MLASANNAAPETVYMPAANRLEDLGLWRVLTQAEYTCVFPAGNEPDPRIVHAIRREVYPWYVPVWIRKVYRAPTGQELVMGWHAIGRWTPMPDDAQKKPVKLLRPSSGFPFKGGYVYTQRVLAMRWPQGSLGSRLLLPPPAIPYDWNLFFWMKAAGYRLLRRPGPIRIDVLERMQAAKDIENEQLAKIRAEARKALNSDRRLVRSAIDRELHKINHPRQYERPTFVAKPYVQARRVFTGKE